MNFLQKIKNFFIAHSLVQSGEVVFNFDEFTRENKVVLSLTGGKACDVGHKTVISVTVKNSSMQTALTLAQSLFSALCPDKNYSKPFYLDGSLVLTVPEKPPYYREKEKSGRHVVSFDVLITSA